MLEIIYLTIFFIDQQLIIFYPNIKFLDLLSEIIDLLLSLHPLQRISHKVYAFLWYPVKL